MLQFVANDSLSKNFPELYMIVILPHRDNIIVVLLLFVALLHCFVLSTALRRGGRAALFAAGEEQAGSGAMS